MVVDEQCRALAAGALVVKEELQATAWVLDVARYRADQHDVNPLVRHCSPVS
jgi:hypothetical protein